MFQHLRRRYVISAGVIIALVIAVALARTALRKDDPPSPVDNATSIAAAGLDDSTDGGNDKYIVTLADKKLIASAIQIEPVSLATLTHTHSVPGRVTYNETRHVELTTPTSGIVTQVLVKPGDTVEARQVVAWLNSAEIGSARADVLQRQAEAELTRRVADRAAMLKDNVTTLTSGLRQKSDFDSLREQLAGHVLGDYREKLFGAYSRLQLAEKTVTNSASLGESGALSGKVMLGYQADFLAARAGLEAACEQADLEVWMQAQQAQASAQDIQRRLEIARQHLSSLLLSEAATSTGGVAPDVKELGASEDDLDHLSLVAVRAPFRGTIERRKFSASERVQANDPLFVLADTTTLWIAAEIRESDWPALAIESGQPLTVVVPAIGAADLAATVEYIGREVSSDTNAIPIVARIENPAGQLRPGLFARVSIPVAAKGDVLTVSTRAIQQHDGKAFVFIAETANRFRRVDVVLGDQGADRVEIVHGLKENDRVVTHGAFVLKSELLLESAGE